MTRKPTEELRATGEAASAAKKARARFPMKDRLARGTASFSIAVGVVASPRHSLRERKLGK